MDFDAELIIKELNFKTSRSSGSGGQHVNKVSSKVILSWDLSASTVFSEDQKTLLANRLSTRLSREEILQLQESADRSQIRNKKRVIQRFIDLIGENLKVDAKRVPTRVPKSVVLKRLDRKRHISQKKAQRRWKRDDF